MNLAQKSVTLQCTYVHVRACVHAWCTSIACRPLQVLGGLEPAALSDLMLQPDSQKYRFLLGGGEASKITRQDKNLFSQAKSAMRVSRWRGGEGGEPREGWGGGGGDTER